MDTQRLGRRVLMRRREVGLSQESLAQRAGLSRNYISLIERGAAENVSVNVVTQLAQALGVPPTQLLEDVDENAMLIPPGLRQLALDDGLRFDVVEWLMRMPRRGREPQTAEEWRDLYDAVRTFFDEGDGG